MYLMVLFHLPGGYISVSKAIGVIAVYLRKMFFSNMRSLIIYLFIFNFISTSIFSQVFPREHDTLCYRIVGFTFPEHPKASGYLVEIASGTFDSPDSFKKCIIKTVQTNSGRVIAELPAFGSPYTWRVNAVHNGKKVTSGPMYHFTIGSSLYVDTNQVRVRVTAAGQKYQDGYFFMDGSRAMYNMRGEPVWFMPELRGALRGNSMIRDLKLSPKGTITFLAEGDAYEVSYGGNLLWKGNGGKKQNTDSMEGYHHELTRLSNGHYMVLGFEAMVRSRARIRDSSMKQVRRDTAAMKAGAMQRKARYGTINEYDEANNLVWSWNAGKYFETQDMSVYNRLNGIPEYDVHENSFYFDEEHKVIYVGFRNVSQVLKVSYPSGEVLQAYGKITSDNSISQNLFCGQHSCRRSADGLLYLFNNGCSITAAPRVTMLKEPVAERDTLAKVWEFECPVAPFKNLPQAMPNRRVLFSSGGSVSELPDGAFLVSTCSPYSMVFIVNRNKEILWSCEPEKWNIAKSEWVPLQQYRTSMIDGPDDLAKLIWNNIGK